MYVPMTFFTVMANVGFDIRQRETVKGLSDFFKTNFKIHGNGFIYILQLFLTAGIDFVPSLSSCFRSKGPGSKLNSSVDRLVESLCRSTTRPKMSLFLICLIK